MVFTLGSAKCSKTIVIGFWMNFMVHSKKQKNLWMHVELININKILRKNVKLYPI
jgi:hypothetical protein